MKIGVIGAPSTGKSVFAKNLAAAMTRDNLSTELVQEYASTYIQQVGAPLEAWEQLVISIGQYLAEQNITRDYVVTDATAFATYVYAQRILTKTTSKQDWPKYRNLLDMLRILARASAQSYDLIFFLTHVFPPRQDGVRIHLSADQCTEIGQAIEDYLQAERIEYHRLKANDSLVLEKALKIIQQRSIVS